MTESEATVTHSSPTVEEQGKGSVQFLAVCRAIQVCQKNFGLYPPSHPRVEASLGELREALTRFSEATGQPFEFSTMGPADGHERLDDTVLDQLRESLMLHFVRSMSIASRATTDELSDICQLLAQQPDDDSTAASAECETNFSSWKNIKLQFYLPKDFSNIDDGTSTAIGRATGIQNLAALAPIFEGVSTRVRTVICNAILNEDLLGRLHVLRDSLKRDGKGASERATSEEMDVVGEILYTILAESSQLEDLDATEDRIRTTLGSLLDFMEKNVDSFRRGLNLYRGDESGCSVTRQIRDAIHSGFELSGEVSDMEEMKERLSFLFQISDDGSQQHHQHVAALEEEDESKRNSSYFGVDESSVCQRPLDETMREIPLDLQAMNEEIRDAAQAGNFVDVAIELLERQASREVVQQSWLSLEQQLDAACKSPRVAEDALERLVRAFQKNASDDLEALLMRVLQTSEFPQGAAFRACESLVKSSAGKRLVVQFVDQYCEDYSDTLLPTINKLRHASSARLRKIGNDKLARACGRPSMLEKLAREDPGTLCAAESLEVIVKKVPMSRLRDGFRRVFERLDVPQVRVLLNNFPEGLEGGEEIFFAASESALSEVRRAALSNLYKYPTPVVVKTLVGTVEGQNQQRRPSLEDIEAAFASLVRIDSPQAQAFLKEVETSRRLLGYVFKKDIRRLLSGVKQKRARKA